MYIYILSEEKNKNITRIIAQYLLNIYNNGAHGAIDVNMTRVGQWGVI